MRRLLTALMLLCVHAIPASAEEPGTGAGAPSPAAAYFEARCALCHQLPDPRQFTPAQWRKVLAVMQLRLAQKGMMPLAEDEMKAIGDFLDVNGRH